MLIFASAMMTVLPVLPQDCSSTKAAKASQSTCNSEMSLASIQSDIVDTAVAAGSFETLVTAVKAADLVEVLKGKGPFTVFAPADSAFAKIPAEGLNALVADKKALTNVLTYHVVPGRLMAKDVLKSKWLTTAQGQSLRVHMDGDKAMIDNAQIVKTDIECSNGIIHVIDSVVQPRQDIVDTAVANGSFKTLVAAVKAAGLVETLKSAGPFTVFAPTDAAFAAIPKAELDALLKDKASLTAILTYHVVPGRVLSTDLKPAKMATAVKTVQGSDIHVLRTDKGEVTINDAKVVMADVIVGNGVIHVIDTVILPKQAGTHGN